VDISWTDGAVREAGTAMLAVENLALVPPPVMQGLALQTDGEAFGYTITAEAIAPLDAGHEEAVPLFQLLR
jgi:hypothetical protein